MESNSGTHSTTGGREIGSQPNGSRLRIPEAPGDSCGTQNHDLDRGIAGTRSGDASEESGARLGDSGQIAPGPDYYPGPCRGGQGLDDEDLEDMGAALLWPAVVATFLIALIISAALLSGCAPRPASSAAAPEWCQDCAVSK